MAKRSAKSSASLIQKVKELSNGDSYKFKRKCWYDDYCLSHPEQAAELLELAQDWVKCGDTKQALPQVSLLYRFCADNCQGLEKVRLAAFRMWIGTLGGS